MKSAYWMTVEEAKVMFRAIDKRLAEINPEDADYEVAMRIYAGLRDWLNHPARN